MLFFFFFFKVSKESLITKSDHSDQSVVSPAYMWPVTIGFPVMRLSSAPSAIHPIQPLIIIYHYMSCLLYADLSVHSNHPGISLKCKLCCSRSGMGP